MVFVKIIVLKKLRKGERFLPRFLQSHKTLNNKLFSTKIITVKRLGGLGDVLLCAIIADSLSKNYNLPVNFITNPSFHKFLYHFHSIEKCTSENACNRAKLPIMYDLQDIADMGIDAVLKPRWLIFADACRAKFLPDKVFLAPFRNRLQINEPFAGIVLRASTPNRTWEGMKTLAHRLRKTMPVALIDEEKQCVDKKFIDLTGKPLCTVLASLRNCRLLITPDTGFLHIAMFFGIPSVAIFGGIDPKLRIWKPELVSIIQNSSLECYPCHEFLTHSCPGNFVECLTSISVKTVFDRALLFLASNKNLSKSPAVKIVARKTRITY